MLLVTSIRYQRVNIHILEKCLLRRKGRVRSKCGPPEPIDKGNAEEH